MTKSIVLLAAGSTWPTDARAYSEIQSFSSSLRGRSDSARQAAAYDSLMLKRFFTNDLSRSSEQATPVAREPVREQRGHGSGSGARATDPRWLRPLQDKSFPATLSTILVGLS